MARAASRPLPGRNCISMGAKGRGRPIRLLGRGGIVAVPEATGMSRSAVQEAAAQVDERIEVNGRVGAPGGGGPRFVDTDLTIRSDVNSLVERDTRFGPMCPLRWTTKLTEHAAQALRAMGRVVSPDTVGQLLKEMGYSLQAPGKEDQAAQYPERDAQFRYLSRPAEAHLAGGRPMIPADAKGRKCSGIWLTRAENASARTSRIGWTCTTSLIRSSTRRSPTRCSISLPIKDS